ncbi:CHAT domain-containing protein [Planobispora rosea]|uniref:CHAT domain-containing protein n=1 Tax=Planobispora rosea TaxID=35762 RepID=UPI00083AF446|nr:CHAT domain-containing tetratricopeptide repeat protein [Planobispora rosea]
MTAAPHDLAGPTADPPDRTAGLLSPVRTAERAVRLAAGDPAASRDLARSVLAALGPAAPGPLEPAVLDALEPAGGSGTCLGTARAGSGSEAEAKAGTEAEAGAEAASVAYRALALAARELGDLPLAEEHLDRAVGIALAAGLPHRAAQARLSLVAVRAELGRPLQALTVAAEAEPYLAPDEVARLGVNRAAALIRLGRHEEAIRHCDGAEGLLDDDPGFLAGAMLNRGLARIYLERFAAAEADLARSAELARAAGLEHVLALAEGNLPFLAARRGDLPAAFTAYLRAERSLFGCPERLATVRCDLAGALIDAHLPGEARVLLDLAVPELAAAGAETALTEARLMLARVQLRAGDAGCALDSARSARAELTRQGRTAEVPLATEIILRARLHLDPPGAPSPDRSHPAREPAGDPPAGAISDGAISDGARLLAEMVACAADLDGAGHPSGPLRLTAAELALRLGDGRTADEQFGRIASAGRGAVARHAVALRRATAGDRRGALAAIRAALAEVGADAARLRDPMVRAHAVRAGEPLAALGLSLALETGRGETVLAWAERWRAVVRGGGRPSAPDLGELRAALGDTALVEFVRDGDGLIAVAVTSDRITLRRLGSCAAVAEATVRLRYGLRRAHLRDGPAPGAAGEAASVERLVLGPFLDGLGERPLVIVPAGVLHTLPWPLLPANADRPVTVAASAAAWLAARRAHAVPGAGTVVVAGPGVRCAEAEADMVAAHRPGTERIAATRPAVTAALERAAVAHLAAHGTFCAHSPLLSGIDLDDGRLMAYDLLRLRLPPALVVLSACETGMARAPADGAPLGLAGTFLDRGARCVVAGLVPVRDEETLTLMTAFHGLLAAGHPPARALALAGRSTGLGGVAGFVCFGYGDQPVATGREGSATQLDQDPT